jgi:hypothetical protein
MSELQFWGIGDPLGYAAIKFGDPFQTEKWKNAGDAGAIDSHELLLMADLFARIQEGEYVAIGFRIAPTVSDGPVKIPEHTFEPRPNLTLTRCDKLQVSGHSYERIRILPRTEAERDKSASRISGNSAGRQSTYAKSKIVIEVLFLTESNRSKSAAKLHPDFEIEFKRQFPSSEWEVAPPSERTLRNHLMRYRQELEETHSP